MLLGNKQQEAYADVQVQANASVSSNFELICMLHERLEQELDTLVYAIESKDYEKKSVCAQKMIDILTGLDSSLDLANSNDLIDSIHNLYEHAIGVVFTASKDLDIEALQHLKAPLQSLHEGWQGAMAQINGQS